MGRNERQNLTIRRYLWKNFYWQLFLHVERLLEYRQVSTDPVRRRRRNITIHRLRRRNRIMWNPHRQSHIMWSPLRRNRIMWNPHRQSLHRTSQSRRDPLPAEVPADNWFCKPDGLLQLLNKKASNSLLFLSVITAEKRAVGYDSPLISVEEKYFW